MACDRAHPIDGWPLWSVSLVLLVAVAGCQKAEAIGHYQVPKEQAAASVADDSTTSPDRMLAAIVTHNNAAWFFKLAGPSEEVGKHAEAFETLVKSVTFSDTEEVSPHWTLPAGWTEKTGGADLRFATITVSAKPPLEITVSTLPWPARQDLEQLLSNINRWRGQLTLKPLETNNLADQIRWAKLAAGEAMLVDFHGTLKPGGMQPPFAAAAGGESGGKPGELPSGHPPLRDPMIVAQKAEPGATAKSDALQAAQPELPFTYTMPSGWSSSRLPPFAVAAFTAKKDSRQVEITVSPLGRGAGGLLSNVNRWRAQIKLPEISEDDLKTVAKTYQVDGKPAQLVQLIGPEAASPRMAITVVVADRENATWFFRMRGDAALAKDEQANFEKFVGSVKFVDEGKK